MYDVRGRNAIVTGASQGLGYEFARRLAMEGAKVCLSDIKIEVGEESAEKLRKMFGKDEKSIFFVKCDVSVAEDWTSMWDHAEKVFGGQVDILCNNAGVIPSAGWETCLNVMSTGFTRGVFTALERMGTSKGGRGGRIINTASIAGITVGVLGPLPNCGYGIAKWGNIILTRLFEASKPTPFETDGVKCYALCPWFADTAMVRPTADVIQRKFKERILTLEEVGEGMMKSVKLDKNGAVYAIYPDIPLIEYPNVRSQVFILNVLFGKVAARLGIELFTPAHFYAMAAIFLWIFYTLLNKFLCCIIFGCN